MVFLRRDLFPDPHLDARGGGNSMTTRKRFPMPDEAHPNRRATVQATYVCANCLYEGDFMFCPYCGKRRVCLSAPEEESDDG